MSDHYFNSHRSVVGVGVGLEEGNEKQVDMGSMMMNLNLQLFTYIRVKYTNISMVCFTFYSRRYAKSRKSVTRLVALQKMHLGLFPERDTIKDNL
jgi:hypothetical protein